MSTVKFNLDFMNPNDELIGVEPAPKELKELNPELGELVKSSSPINPILAMDVNGRVEMLKEKSKEIQAIHEKLKEFAYQNLPFTEDDKGNKKYLPQYNGHASVEYLIYMYFCKAVNYNKDVLDILLDDTHVGDRFRNEVLSLGLAKVVLAGNK